MLTLIPDHPAATDPSGICMPPRRSKVDDNGKAYLYRNHQDITDP